MASPPPPRTWTLRIRAADERIFRALAGGEKAIETRAGSLSPRGVSAARPGDTVLFLCGPARLRRRVVRVARYPSVAALLAGEDSRRIAPWLADPLDLAALYAGFAGYSERIARYGLVALELAPPDVTPGPPPA
jgi:hypothetical protein